MYNTTQRQEILMKTRLPEQLKKLMNKEDMTPTELADYLKVTTATISRWLTGSITPRLNTLFELCELFKVDVYTLLGIKDPNNLTEEEKNIINAYRNDAEFKVIVDRIIK